MFQTTSVDIHRGVYGERQVCLKKYRGCTQSRSQLADGQDLDRMTEVSIISGNILTTTQLPPPDVDQGGDCLGELRPPWPSSF